MPGEWGSVELQEVADVNSESLGADTSQEFTFKYIDISSVTQGVVNWNTVQHLVFRTAPSRARRILRKDDFLLCTVRPGLEAHTAAPWANRENFVASTGFAVIRSHQDLNPRFLAQLAFSPLVANQLRAREVGSNYPAVTERDVRQLSIPLPPLPEQRRIAEVLDTLDTVIERTEALVQKLKLARAGLLHDLLTRGLDEQGQLRDPERNPEAFTDSELGRLPKTWDIGLLGEVLARSAGFFQTGPFGSQLHAREYVDDGVPVVMPQDMVGGVVSETHIARITQRRANTLKRHKLRVNDVLFARRGDLSRCAVISTREVGWLCGTGCLLARFPETTLLGNWLSLVYGHDFGQRQVSARAVGSTMVNLNTGLLSGLTLPFPAVEEQQGIVKRMHGHDARVMKEQAQLDKLRQLKRGMMEDLLTGRVRVGVPEAVAGEAS